MKNTALRRALALALVLAASGCFLPPPAENRPLTGALGTDTGGERRPGAGMAAATGEDDPERVSQDGTGAADPGTTLLEVQAAPGGGLEPIGGVDETVAVAAEIPELPEDSGPPENPENSGNSGNSENAAQSDPSESEVPWESGDGAKPSAEEVATDGAAKAPADRLPVAALDDEPDLTVTLIPLEVETSDGLVMSYLFKDADDPTQGAPAVVFIHGWCGRADQWSDAMEAVAKERRVYAVDLIGHGRSKGQSRIEWTVSKFGGDIVRLLEDQQIESAILVGHGMGGQVALSTAARAPSRIAGILGVDCLQRLAGDPKPEQVEPHVQAFTLAYGEQMRKFVDEAVHASTAPEVKERIIEDCLAADKGAALALMEHFGVHDPRRVAPKIECGVACINSEALRTDVAGNRSLLSSFDLRTIEDTGHWIHLESPTAFVRELKAYLGGLNFESEPVSVLEMLHPVLIVQDVASVLAFYTEGLGFQVIRRQPQDTAEAARVVTLERDGARVVIQSVASLLEEMPGSKVQTGGGRLFVRVSAVDVELRNLGKDVTVLSPKRTLVSGAKRAVVSDPEGNVVVLQQRAAKGLDKAP